jgi:hypothetical protein
VLRTEFDADDVEVSPYRDDDSDDEDEAEAEEAAEEGRIQIWVKISMTRCAKEFCVDVNNIAPEAAAAAAVGEIIGVDTAEYEDAFSSNRCCDNDDDESKESDNEAKRG